MLDYNSEFANEVVNLLSASELMKHTREISKYERLSGSEGEAKAFEYIKEFLSELNLETKMYYADTFISNPICGKIAFDHQELKANPPSMSASTHIDGITAIAKYIDIMELNAGISQDLSGIIAVIDGMPMPSLLETLNTLKCIGAVFVQSADLVSEGILTPIWGSPSIKDRHLIPTLPVVSINRGDGEILKKRLLEKPNEPITLYASLDTGWRKIPILISELKSDNKTDDFVLFSGHVDSWYYGAMDNGSANATMLEIARVMSLEKDKVKRNLRLAFWSGHSHGRYAGSAWYADEFWQELYDNCVAHINVDSVGAKDATILTQAHIMEETKPIAAKYIKEFANQELEGIRVGRAGDQSFWGHGIPSLFITLSEQPPDASKDSVFAKIVGGSSKTSGLGWWWHTPADTFDKIDPDNLLRDAKIYSAIVARFCNDEILPIDVRLSIDEIFEQLNYWQNEAGNRFDIQEILDKLGTLRVKTNEAYNIILSGINEGDKIEIFNSLIKGLDRILIPINYVAGDVFYQDPAINQPAVPSLSILKGLKNENNEAVIQEIIVEAKRRKNRILFKLIEGIKLTESVLKCIKQS